MEIKEYFLQKDIDIDNVRKSYYFMQENIMTREEVAKVELDKAYERLLKIQARKAKAIKRSKFEHGRQSNPKFKLQSSQSKFDKSRFKEICEGLR